MRIEGNGSLEELREMHWATTVVDGQVRNSYVAGHKGPATRCIDWRYGIALCCSLLLLALSFLIDWFSVGGLIFGVLGLLVTLVGGTLSTFTRDEPGIVTWKAKSSS